MVLGNTGAGLEAHTMTSIDEYRSPVGCTEAINWPAGHFNCHIATSVRLGIIAMQGRGISDSRNVISLEYAKTEVDGITTAEEGRHADPEGNS